MTPQETIRRTMQEYVDAVRAEGYVVTVEQRPLQPLAMGHYAPHVTVRPARVMATTPDHADIHTMQMASVACATGGAGLLAYTAHLVRQVDPVAMYGFVALAWLLLSLALVMALYPLPLFSVGGAG